MNSSEETQQCSICQSDGVSCYRLSCDHYFHLKCLEGLVSLKCPLCRADMANLPRATQKKIETNHAKWEEEKLEEERRCLVVSEMKDIELPLNLQVQNEVRMAIRLLCETFGVPCQFLPFSVNVKVYPDRANPIPPIGYFFSAMTNTVVKHIVQELEKEGIFDDSDDDDDDNDSPSDAPIQTQHSMRIKYEYL